MTMHDILEHFSVIPRKVSGMRTNWFRPKIDSKDNGTAELVYRFKPYSKIEGQDVYLSLYIRSGEDVTMDEKVRNVLGYDDLSIGMTKSFEKENGKKEVLFPRVFIIPNYHIPLILPFLGGIWKDMLTEDKETNKMNSTVLMELLDDILKYIVKEW